VAESDFQYFHRRASEERAAAQSAMHPVARQSHLELANRYEEMAVATNATVVQLYAASHV
jgi:hypothetical protein